LALRGGEWSTSRPGRFFTGNEIQFPLSREQGEPHIRSVQFGKEKIETIPEKICITGKIYFIVSPSETLDKKS